MDNATDGRNHQLKMIPSWTHSNLTIKPTSHQEDRTKAIILILTALSTVRYSRSSRIPTLSAITMGTGRNTRGSKATKAGVSFATSKAEEAALKKAKKKDEKKKEAEEKKAASKRAAEEKRKEEEAKRQKQLEDARAKAKADKAVKDAETKKAMETNPLPYVTFVDIQFNVPDPEDTKPIIVWITAAEKLFHILADDGGDDTIAITHYHETDFTKLLKQDDEFPDKLTLLRKFFLKVIQMKEGGRCYTGIKIIHSETFDDIKTNASWELKNHDMFVTRKKLQVADVYTNGWISGLHEDINEQQWETFTNEHLEKAYIAMTGTMPREPYVVAFKNQFVYEGGKISEATKKNRATHPHIQSEDHQRQKVKEMIRWLIANGYFKKLTSNRIQFFPAIDGNKWKISGDAPLEQTRAALLEAHRVANQRRECMAVTEVDDFQSADAVDPGTRSTLRELMINWTIPIKDAKGEITKDKDGNICKGKPIALVEKQRNGSHRIVYFKRFETEALDFIKASGTVLAHENTDSVLSLYNAEAQDRFETMYMEDGVLKSKSADKINEDLETLKQDPTVLDMQLVLQDDKKKQEAQNKHNEEQAHNHLRRHDHLAIGDAPSVYTAGEQLKSRHRTTAEDDRDDEEDGISELGTRADNMTDCDDGTAASGGSNAITVNDDDVVDIHSIKDHVPAEATGVASAT